MPKTAGERIRAAVRQQRTSLAAVARQAEVPAPWLRSFATDHVHRGDPQRIRRVADVLGLDYRELLALTDQLGAVEQLERTTTPAAPATDIARLAAAIEAQTLAINALVSALGRSAVDRPAWVDAAIAEVQDTVLGGIRLASMQQASDAHAHTGPLPQDQG